MDLTNNYNLALVVTDIVHSLRKTKIEVLNLTRTCFGAVNQESIVMQKLKQTRIKVLIADWNEIRLPNDSFFNVLPNIQELSVRNNELIDFAGFFLNIYNASHLRKVDLSYQSTVIIESEGPTLDTFAMKLQVQKMPGQHYCHHQCHMMWPPKLEWFAFSGLGYVRQEMLELFFMNNGSIKYVDLSNNIIETIPEPLLRKWSHCHTRAHPYIQLWNKMHEQKIILSL